LALVKGWQRLQGVVYRTGDARFEDRSAQDAVKAALADPACIMVNRNAGAVAQGRADWGVAIEPVAKLYGLAFLPLAPEEYDFLLVEKRRERPAVQAFLAALRDEATRARVRTVGMRIPDPDAQ